MEFEIFDIEKIQDNYPQKRDCFEKLMNYLNKKTTSKICVIYGLRRTGKTVLMQQALKTLSEEHRKQSVYIRCNNNTDFYDVLNFLKNNLNEGKKYFFIDEVTYAKNFQNLAEVLSDNFVANYNARIVLTGTDSLGLSLPSHSNLYDRAEFVHTTYISFPEFARIMKNNSVDFFMDHGNTLSENNPFENPESAKKYIETSIVSNLIDSLQKSEGVRSYPPTLTELYNNNDLENAIQRIINSYPQTIILKALKKEFELSPLKTAEKAIVKATENPDLTIKSVIEEEKITENVRKLLKIDTFKEEITQQHLDDIKDFLKEMDVITTIPVVTSYINNTQDINMELITHPGMYHANLLYTLDELRKDNNWFPQATIEQKERLIQAVQTTSAGKIMENFIITDVYKMLCSNNAHNRLFDDSERWYVSKFSHDINSKHEEADLIIFDKKNKETFLFEIKHSKESHEDQVKYLESSIFINYIEQHFSPVKNCVVLYNGNNDVSQITPRLNISDFLIHMYNNYKNPDYSIKNTIECLCNQSKRLKEQEQELFDFNEFGKKYITKVLEYTKSMSIKDATHKTHEELVNSIPEEKEINQKKINMYLNLKGIETNEDFAKYISEIKNKTIETSKEKEKSSSKDDDFGIS